MKNTFQYDGSPDGLIPFANSLGWASRRFVCSGNIYTPLPRVAFDFDGTINIAPWGKPFELNPGFAHAFDFTGVKILYTLRTGDWLKAAVSWLESQGIYFDEINSQVSWGSSKTWADVYLDDSAYGAPLVDGYFNLASVDTSFTPRRIHDV